MISLLIAWWCVAQVDTLVSPLLLAPPHPRRISVACSRYLEALRGLAWTISHMQRWQRDWPGDAIELSWRSTLPPCPLTQLLVVRFIAQCWKATSAPVRLDLPHCCHIVASAAADAIAANKIEQLHLDSSLLSARVADNLLAAAARSSRLLHLCLAGTYLGGARMAAALGRVVRDNVVLEHLDLSFTGIGDVALQAMGAGLDLNHTLVALYLDGNAFTTASWAAFGRAMQQNRSLTSLSNL